jgi:site-specific recombinase XerD
MTRSKGKLPFKFKNTLPLDPAVQRLGDWLPANRDCYEQFRKWLKDGSYSSSAVALYGVAVRTALGYLHKPYWRFDPDADLALVRDHICQRPLSPSTFRGYEKGLRKFAEFLRYQRRLPPMPKKIDWQHFLAPLPGCLQENVRDFLSWRQCSWKEQQRFERTMAVLSHLTWPLRWMASQGALQNVTSLTPQAWFAYVDHRISSGISPRTLNAQLSGLKHFVHYLLENGTEVCERFLLVDYLEEGSRLPKDIPIQELRSLQETIQAEAASENVGRRRSGRMDLAWFLLMLHSGLRTAEVRNLKPGDIEWEQRRLLIEQSKGLKDRLVYLSQATLAALRDYIEVRGPADALPENLFVGYQRPLGKTYFYEKLETYGKRCGVRVAPHQLRHCCATLLLNAGAPVVAVQAILGHKNIDTTLIYARLYDGTIAADYYRAMVMVERQLALPEDRLKQPPSIGELLAMVDSLQRGTLSPTQMEILGALRAGLANLAEGWPNTVDVREIFVQRATT